MLLPYRRAVANISEAAAAKQRLADLCETLVDSLDENDSSFLAKLAALSSIGRAAPDVLSEHATFIVDFVSQASKTPSLFCSAGLRVSSLLLGMQNPKC